MNTAATKRRTAIIGVVVLALVASLLVWFATRSDGEIVRKADLNDGGVWVTNAEQARYGRINKPAGQLDAGVVSGGTSGSGLDVLQAGSAVLGISKASNQLVPINAAEGTIAPEQAIVLPKASTATGNQVFTAPVVDLRGGTVAMIDPAKGDVRAERVDEHAGVESLDALQTQAKPIATVGGNAAVAVGVDGAVYALSAEKGVLAILRPQGQGFAKPEQVGLDLASKSAQVTAVGGHWVVYDSGTGRLFSDRLEQPEQLSVGDGEPGTPAYAALQQPGPDADTVLIQDRAGLTNAPIVKDAKPGGGVKVSQAGPQAAVLLSAPVRLGSCVHAAWAGAGRAFYGRNCGSPGDASTIELASKNKGVRSDGVKLRVNRGLIVLNDLDSGDVWDVDRGQIKIDDWSSLIPPPQTDDKNKKKDENLVDDEVSRTPPKALPDSLQVRAGRTSTLHVLDNDSDSQGSILAISPADVGKASQDGIVTSASADGQTVQVTVPDEAQGQFSFDYTVNNGTTAKNGRATAKVTVRIVDDNVNTPPKLRAGQKNLTSAKYPVVHSGTVKVGVIADWRDAESDPIQVSPLDPATGVDGSGALTVKAQDKRGDQVVEYQVDDGRGGTTKARITLSVLGDDDRAVAPRTQPDVLRAVVGKPVQLQPLGNDIPGADPSDTEARLQLAQSVKGPGQLTLDTNLDTNTLTVTGSTPGTSTITYAAQSGSGVSVGRVRVDILPNPSADLPPVATPDAAVVRGQTPVIADVLTNDYSPRSDVLVVQKVVTSSAWLRVSVVQGRWVRVEAKAPLPGSALQRGTVDYTISDGTKTAVGQLSVVQKPEPKEKIRPTVVDDDAVVRVGDAVTIPVLDNDSMSEGIPLRLNPTGVKVVSGGGQAFASGTVVRYVPADTKITGPKTALLEYQADPEGTTGRGAVGRVQVTINPLPGATHPDQAPTARSFSASVTAGDTLSITVPTSGVDPDGDLTFVGGIVGEKGGAVNLSLGRVLGFGATTIRYEAYPRSSGTEVIRYQLRDRFGLSSEGFVRVGVVQPGDPQPPVAVEDDIVAAPGRTVRADLLSNDLIAEGDEVQFERFDRLNDPDVLKDFRRQSDNTFKVVAPNEDAGAKVLTYGITDGLFDPSRSTLTVRGQKNFNNPPIAVDDTGVAKQGDTSIVVDVLANDRDLDGDQASLKVTKVLADGAVKEGRKVRITLRPEARVVPYVIEDADGAVAMALIYVPAGSNGLPYVVSGKTIKLGADSSAKVNLADYVIDPRGGKVSLTSPDTISTSPTENLQQQAASATELTLTSTNGYVGPAAVVLEVTNATGPNDKAAQSAYVTIPVQIGPDVPVLRCPDYEVTLAADGLQRSVDITKICRIWWPAGLDRNKVQFEAKWDPAIDGVDLTQASAGGRQVVFKAQPAAKAGMTGAVTVNARGGAEKFKIRVRVTSAPPLATLRPARVDGLIAGTSRTVNLAQFLDSPLTDPQCTIASSRVVSGSGVTTTQSGCLLTVVASDKSRGDATISVGVTDAPGRPLALGTVGVSVRSRPDPTGAPTAVADRVLGGTARVDWRPPAYDGGLPILQYGVTPSGGTEQSCGASPCTITGLKNGQPVTFTVRSRNAVGWSDPSPASNAATPDKKPEQTFVGTLTPGDRQLAATWAAPKNGGSAITKFRLQWINISGGANGQAEMAAGVTNRVITGLVNNDAYQVRVQAQNGAGWGPYGPAVKGQSFGKPTAVAAPNLSPRTPTPDAANAQVSISWPATNPNGPAITKYQVYRRAAGGAWALIASVSGGAQRVASDSVPYQGQTVEYVVTATNGGQATSDRSNFSSYRADGIPAAPTLGSVVTPSANYAANASFSLGDSRSRGYDHVEWRTSAGRSGSWAGSPTGGSATGLGTSRQSMSIRACNVAGRCSQWSNGKSYQPYGPTGAVPGLRESHNDNSVTFTWGTTASNGRTLTGYQLDGDRTATVGAGTHSTTFSGLGYSTSKSMRVRAIAQDSGPGPWTATVTGKTNAAPPPPPARITGFRGVGNTGVVDGCSTGSCQYLQYDLQDFTGRVTCTFASSNGPWPYNNDDGTHSSITPKNGRNTSGKFFGYPTGWVKVTCSDSNGSDSATKNPWGNG
ncbi:MAG: Ig-like domain-containing protein [Humibacillus sp.]|nr:Ig-like domain-containing protein [Humibacillus sp.]MDN5776678.1 Ig-like domain-containing protein [Humibacillus sp.]